MSDSTGKVVWRANYLPFGEEMIDLSTVQNNKMFVGKEKDSESGLYYFGARYMDAEAGRFTSPDSIGAVDPRTGKINQIILNGSQRLNRYAYALNNPYRYYDPQGLWSVTIDAYDFFGASITFGKGEGQPFFFSSRLGLGTGGGFSFDPDGKSPSNNPNAISAIGTAESIGYTVGPVDLSIDLHSGVAFLKPGTSSLFGNSWDIYVTDPTTEPPKPILNDGILNLKNIRVKSGGYVAIEGTLYPGNISSSLSSGTSAGLESKSYDNIPGQD